MQTTLKSVPELMNKMRLRISATTLWIWFGLIVFYFSLLPWDVEGYNDMGIIFTFLGAIFPCTIILFRYFTYSLLDQAFTENNPLIFYLIKGAVIIILSVIPVFLLSLLLTENKDISLPFSLLNIPIQLILPLPLSWFVYKKQMKSKQEINMLKQELGQTSANIDFLRSQISPHFLFNALNTIYGTAIQEKAERTSDGIEKLGDMMRFMLQENMQEKIPLSREINYLQNYISLQKLRIEASDAVRIQINIQEYDKDIQIAPMLLIPFVENAFKHGISFREPSLISITLEIKDDILHFDVYNNKHTKKENDPEKDEGGIGLVNVQQRLKLQYADNHNLLIRETNKEFFVHLVINFK